MRKIAKTLYINDEMITVVNDDDIYRLIHERLGDDVYAALSEDIHLQMLDEFERGYNQACKDFGLEG